MKYILNGKLPVKCDDVIEWADWLEKSNRHVCLTEKDGVKVSTVFLGIDYSFEDNLPLLFETMVFGGKHDEDLWRYSTWEEAEKGHADALKLVFGKGK